VTGWGWCQAGLAGPALAGRPGSACSTTRVAAAFKFGGADGVAAIRYDNVFCRADGGVAAGTARECWNLNSGACESSREGITSTSTASGAKFGMKIWTCIGGPGSCHGHLQMCYDPGDSDSLSGCAFAVGLLQHQMIVCYAQPEYDRFQ
jgi:hypothetical protein